LNALQEIGVKPQRAKAVTGHRHSKEATALKVNHPC
jgi:hypothetical protein